MSPQIRLVLVSDAMQSKSHRHHNPLGACESLGRKLRFSTVRFSVWFPEVGIAHGEGSLSPLLTFQCAKGTRFARPTCGAAWQSMCNGFSCESFHLTFKLSFTLDILVP